MMRPRLLVAVLAASSVALSGCGFHGLYSANLPGGADLGDHPYSLTIYFANVLDLVPQSAVKVNDVAVGKVNSVVLSGKNDKSGDPTTNGWTAKVTVSVNGGVQLPSNARAAVQMTSLLGEKYVALEQPLGTPSDAYLRSGSSIPITRTGTAPEVEEVLGALSLLLNGGGLQQIRVITSELNKALKGNESAVRDLLTQLNTFVGTLDKQKTDITDALDSLDRLTTTLNKQRQTIAAALDTFPQALKILRDDRTKLVTLLGSLSNLGTVATDVIGKTQHSFVSALKALAPVVEQLAAAGSDLPGSLKIGLTFPFPVGTTLQAVKGDYANLHAVVNLDLSDTLCGLNTALCGVVPAPASASHAKLGTDTANSTPEPTLIGMGG